MKLITAMVAPEKLEDVQRVLSSQEAYVSCANETLDLQNPVNLTYRGTQHHTYRHGLRIEVVVANDLMVDEVVDAIAKAASTGDSSRTGSCRILVTTLDEWVRIPEYRRRPERELEAVGVSARKVS